MTTPEQSIADLRRVVGELTDAGLSPDQIRNEVRTAVDDVLNAHEGPRPPQDAQTLPPPDDEDVLD